MGEVKVPTMHAGCVLIEEHIVPDVFGRFVTGTEGLVDTFDSVFAASTGGRCHEQPIWVSSCGTLTSLRQRLQTLIALSEDPYFQQNLSMAAATDTIDAAVVDVVLSQRIPELTPLAGITADFCVPIAY